MPRIDPQQLLSCLSVLLSPNGGILSSTEVQRLASLMTKFSKKLVSKCVYVLILKSTETSLLGSFMAEGGWNLVHVWLQDAYLNKNWPLVKELLQLLLMTPVDVERLKMNNLPKVVKGLSRREDLPEIQQLSNELVQLWLKIVKDETKPQSIVENVKVDTPLSEIKDSEVTVDEIDNSVAVRADDYMETDSKIDEVKEECKENIETVASSACDDTSSDNKSVESDHQAKTSDDALKKSDGKDGEKKDSSGKKSSSSSSRHKSSSSKSSSSSKDKSKSSSSSRDKDKHRDKDKEKSSSRDKTKDKSKDKDKDKHRSNGSHKSSKSSSSSKDKKDTKEKQAEKDKDTLAKVQPPSLSKMGRIPKKSEDAPPDGKTKEVKKPSMSIEVRKNTEERPKTVKVFNAKMRSTGLLEEAKPPPPRSAVVKKPTPVLPATIPVKRPSPIRDPIPLPEKKSKLDPPERPGAIKLIPPKPKPSLQESDIFMDALNFAATANKKDTKKRKRRPSANKEPTTPTDTKPPTNPVNTTPPASPDPQPANSTNGPASPPLALKNIAPFNFYQDTLNTGDDDTAKEGEEKTETSDKDETGGSSPKKQRISSPNEDKETVPIIESRETKGVKGVLLYTKKKGPKRSIRWKEDSELVQVQYFELDETERVNVTRAFTDMARMELTSEREALQLSRKTPNEDLMDVQTIWRPLIEVDVQPPLSEVVCRSLEKDIQFAREKSVLQALYFSKRMVPDSPAEPDPQNQPMTDPKIIPLEPTDEAEQEEPKPIMAWPEPKGSPPPANVPHNIHGMVPPQMIGGFNPQMMGQGMGGPFHQQQMQNFPPNMGQMGPQGFPGNIPPNFGNAGNFMNPNLLEYNMGLMHQQPPMGGDQMMPQPNGGVPGPGMFGPDNFGGMNNDHHGGFQNPHFGGGPHQNQMFPPPNQGPPNFRGRGGFRRGGGNNWMRMNGPGNWNNNRGGGGGDRMGPGGPNRGNRICKNIKNHGYCRNRDNCPFYHPNV